MLERKVFFCIDVFPNWKQLQYSHTMSNMDKQETRSLYFLCMGWHRSAVLNFLLGKFEFEQFCLHANHFLLFACPLPPVTALFVNSSTQPTMCQQKGSSICLSVFSVFFSSNLFCVLFSCSLLQSSLNSFFKEFCTHVATILLSQD